MGLSSARDFGWWNLTLKNDRPLIKQKGEKSDEDIDQGKQKDTILMRFKRLNRWSYTEKDLKSQEENSEAFIGP